MTALKILHVTESMGGGVVTFVESIARRQSEAGAEVSVLYAVRPDTPDQEVVGKRIGQHARLLPAVHGRSGLMRGLGLLRATRQALKSARYDVVHLHSSIAGGVGRVAAVGQQGATIAYSPHGFAFLREDKSRLSRLITRTAERLLGRMTPLILTSASERDLAISEVRAKRTALLQSGVPSSSIPEELTRPQTARPRVVMVGRLAYQKAPWRFAHVARELGDIAEFVWIGSGTAPSPAEWLGDAPVSLIPWVTPTELDDLLDAADVLLFPSLWEGMSLSLIQAQSRGLPCVVSDVVGNRDAVVHGKTGYVCRSDEDLVSATKSLVLDYHQREVMGNAARVHALSALTDDSIGVDSIALYRQWGAGQL